MGDHSLKRYLRPLEPPALRDVRQETTALMDHVRQLSGAMGPDTSVRDTVELVVPGGAIASTQKPGEIARLVETVKALEPERLCEIGASRGGTLFLLAQAAAPQARILSIDIAFRLSHRLAYPRLAGRSQRITCLRADSRSPDTLLRVAKWLRGGAFDFLLIDGDHSAEGVKGDFRAYAPMVRKGGIIAFHDIVPDFRTRFGRRTAADVGDVPVFWRDLKSAYTDTVEFIDDPDQDGFGIGVLAWDGILRV